MSVVELFIRQNKPLKDIPELPMCERCGNRVATVPLKIGEMEYTLCVPCTVRPPAWSIPK